MDIKVCPPKLNCDALLRNPQFIQMLQSQAGAGGASTLDLRKKAEELASRPQTATTGLQVAKGLGHMRLVERLLPYSDNVEVTMPSAFEGLNKTRDDYAQEVLAAANMGNNAELSRLLKEGCDPNATGESYVTTKLRRVNCGTTTALLQVRLTPM
jgi:hypothetical protein